MLRASVLSFFVLLFVSPLFAAQNTIVGHFGMTQSRFVFGGEFEYRSKKSHAYSAHFLMLGEDDRPEEGVRRWGQILAGGTVKIFFGPSRWQLYVGPGFALGMIDVSKVEGALLAVETQTTFGPSLSTGFFYRFSKKIGFGLEYMKFFNWFSGEASLLAEYSYSTATIRFGF